VTYAQRFKEWAKIKALELELKGLWAPVAELVHRWATDPVLRTKHNQSLEDFLAVTADRLEEAARAIRRFLSS
jgi:hypothetical protein